MRNSRIVNKKSIEFLRYLLADNTRFLKYTEKKFYQINDNERRRKRPNQFEEARRNAKLNRYCNIVPYDTNCIKLTDARLGSPDEYYINASMIIAPYETPRSYIATQGPLETTLLDFWRMVGEYKVSVIVCLTPESENGIPKCARYWPLDETPLVFSNEKINLTVTTKRSVLDRNANSMVRSISLEFYDRKTHELIHEQQVTQLQFLGWPDHGVPAETTGVINLIRLSRAYNHSGAPMVVHCSAGCGRTGTFCVIDAAEEWLCQKQDVLVDPVFEITDEYRKQRTTMVQAQAQYDFCYKALSDFIDQDLLQE